MSSYRHIFFVSCGSFFTVIGALTPQSISSPLPLCKSRKLVFLSGNWWVLTNWTHSPSRFFSLDFFFFFFSIFSLLTFPLAGVCFETKRRCVETALLNKTRVLFSRWRRTRHDRWYPIIGSWQIVEVSQASRICFTRERILNELAC